MPTCEHFIYTTAKTNLKTGYQVIAKSKNVDDRLLSSLANYLYPLGVNPAEFKESKSLLSVGKDNVAYSIVKNIGVGYDGRSGTLYNHTIILTKDDFEKLDYDTRIFDKYFIENYDARGELDPLYIQPESHKIDFVYLQKLDRNLLSTLLYYFFKKGKIAIIKTYDDKLIQNILSVIPPQIRFMPFSTLVFEPSRQSKYHIIQIPSKIQSKLESNYAIIDPDALLQSKLKLSRDIGIQEIIDLIYEHNEKEIDRLYDDFEKMITHAYKTKRVKIKNIFDKEKCKTLAENKNFSILEKYVRSIYSNSDFNDSSPRTMFVITKKISNILKKSFKAYDKGKISDDDLVKLSSISKILLDCLHYIKEYNEKKIDLTLLSEIDLEIKKLEFIMKQYPESTTIIQNYNFSIYEYLNQLFENSLNFVYSMNLWLLGKK
jgi:hypothetical protein